MMDKALQLSQRQTQMAVEVSRAMTAGLGALLEASLTYATANAENQMALATAMLSAKSPEAAAALQRAYLNHSLHSAGEMATKIAGAFVVAAKPFETAAASAAPAKGAP